MTMRAAIILSACLTSLSAASALSPDHVTPAAAHVRYSVALSGGAEVPPNESAGNGTVQIRFDKAAGTLDLSINYNGLSGPVLAGHVHGPGSPDTNADVMFMLDGDLGSPIEARFVLDAAQQEAFAKGLLYINLHTEKYPDGELRAQLSPH